MASDAPLTELCSICYINKPKYRCPRCKIRTCSLPCYNKHQQRASCNGKRDPAEYLKKNQLATPVGIDRDYNFLKGVESSIDNARREDTERGTDGTWIPRNLKRGWHPDSGLQKYLKNNKITMQRAPRGMSRQKTNNTRVTKRGRIVWTVEWIDVNGQKDIQDDCVESDSIQATHERLDAMKEKATENHAAGASPGKQRRLQESQPVPRLAPEDESSIDAIWKEMQSENAQDDPNAIIETEPADESEMASIKAKMTENDITDEPCIKPEIEEEESPDHQDDPDTLVKMEDTEELEQKIKPEPLTGEHLQLEQEDLKLEQEEEHGQKIKAEPIDDESPPQNDAKIEDPSDEDNVIIKTEADHPIKTGNSHNNTATTRSPRNYYYLHLTSQPSASRILHPISSKVTLTKALENQTVFEYPTIYVLKNSPHDLPEGFLLDKDFRKVRRAEKRELKEATRMVKKQETEESSKEEAGSAGGFVDANKLLDMLKRDVTR